MDADRFSLRKCGLQKDKLDLEPDQKRDAAFRCFPGRRAICDFSEKRCGWGGEGDLRDLAG
jgi:hypothetical protein